MTRGYNILDADSYLFVSLLEDVATLVKMLKRFLVQHAIHEE